MKRLLRLLAGVAAVGLVLTTAPLASATPKPRSDEWWFSVWGITKHIWPQTKGAGVTVAVLDSGVNASVPELSGAVLRGGDTTGEKSDGRTDFDEQKDGHGTAMAALIAAHGGGNSGFVGIAPKAKILPIHVATRMGDVGFGEALSDGIRFAVDHDAKVINMSQGANSENIIGHCPLEVRKAVGYAIHHDVVLIAGAGNRGDTTNWPKFPASCSGVLAVGAIGEALRPWEHTQRQSYVAVAAPGVDVGWVGKSGTYYPKSQGTSASAALTSGAIALIRSANPDMSARTVVQRLIATAKPTEGLPDPNKRTGYGAIQVSAAIDPKGFPVPADAPNPVYAAFAKAQASHSAAVNPDTAPPDNSMDHHAKKKEKGTGWELPALLVAIGVVVVALAVLVGIMLRRRSRRSSPAALRDRPVDPSAVPSPRSTRPGDSTPDRKEDK